MNVAAEHERFAELLDRHGAAVMGLLRRLCRNRHDAEDLFQEVAARVWRYRDRRPELRNERGWLMTIAYRTFVDSREPVGTVAVPLPAALAAHSAADVSTAAETRDDADQVGRALEMLSPALRSVVVMHYSGGLSIREAAAALGISVGTAKSRLAAALEQLRRQLP